MLKALVWKESRELAPLVALAVVAELLFYFPTNPLSLFYYSYSNYSSQIPFVSSTLQTWLLVVGAFTGIGLGFWQSSGELSRDTFLYLLHRPIERHTVFLIKVAVGVVLTLLVAGVPILAYAIWASIPGNHPSPFFWSMTVSTWLIWFRLPLFYLGAHLSGIRPGRWLGSRAVPLAAAPLLFAFLFVTDSLPVVSLLATLLVEGVFLWVIFYVADTRDYS